MPSLYFYYGVMESGKSTHLLQADYNYKQRGMKTILYLPEIVAQERDNKIKSRIGLEKEAIVFDTSYVFKEENVRGVSCIFIDEAQFLTKMQVFQLLKITIVPILCYGLRSDFQCEKFEGSMYLLLLADHLCEIKSICQCSKKATLNKRLDNKTEQISVNSKYKSFCRRCFFTC